MNICFLKYLKNISGPSDFEKHLMNICFLKYLKNISSPSDFEKHSMNICFLKYLKNVSKVFFNDLSEPIGILIAYILSQIFE